MSKISSEARGYDKSIPDIFTLLIHFIRLFSRFTISAIAQQYIRVSSATLEVEKGEQELSIFGTLSQKREIIVRPQEA
jgi:VIT1/CCC1 family predicted Fe2+/Mn2+ transporter